MVAIAFALTMPVEARRELKKASRLVRRSVANTPPG